MALDPGIYSGLSMEMYLSDPCVSPSLSSGGAHTILTQSPAHCWADHPRNPKRKPREESTDMDIGSIAHELLLEKSEARACVIDPHDYRGKRGGIPDGWTNDAIRAARDAARAEGKIPILLKDMERVRAMMAVAHEFIRHSEIADVFADGEPEATVIACEGDTWLRARPDWITHDRAFTVSFKTTPGSAEPNSFVRGRLFSLGYDMALAFYERAILAATGKAPRSCLLIQETNEPYACALVGLDPMTQELAERKVEMAIGMWRKCVASGVWPAYPTRICYAAAPAWEIARTEEAEQVGLEIDMVQLKEGIQI